MNEETKRSTVYGLYEEMTGTEVSLSPSKTKYAQSTKTLYSHELEINARSKKQKEIAQIPLEREEYKKLAEHRRNFVLTNQRFYVGQEVRLQETKGLQATGCFMIRRVEDIVSYLDNPGLKDGFSIVTF